MRYKDKSVGRPVGRLLKSILQNSLNALDLQQNVEASRENMPLEARNFQYHKFWNWSS